MTLYNFSLVFSYLIYMPFFKFNFNPLSGYHTPVYSQCRFDILFVKKVHFGYFNFNLFTFLICVPQR